MPAVIDIQNVDLAAGLVYAIPDSVFAAAGPP